MCHRNEVRLCGLLLLVEEMKAATPKRKEPPKTKAERRKEIADFFLSHARQANNWDLVDLSCEHILGTWLLWQLPDGTMPDRNILDRLADSENLWEQRIAIVSTFTLIRAYQFDDTFGSFRLGVAAFISSTRSSNPHSLTSCHGL